MTDNKREYKLIYSLGEHPYLGFLIEPHIVYLNKNGSFSLSHQRVFSHTIKDFKKNLDPQDYQIIKILDRLEQQFVIKYYFKSNLLPAKFFNTSFSAEDYDTIRPKLEQKMQEVLPLLRGKPFFLMHKDGYPAHKPISVAEKPTSILFHFRRNESNTHYFPTLKHDGKKLEFMYRGTQIVVNQQAWILIEDTLYYFDEELEGKKLQPFLNKRFIAIPRSTEERYYKTFVKNLIASHSVFAKGFKIKTLHERATTHLILDTSFNEQATINIVFQYGNYRFHASTSEKNAISVELEKDLEQESYTFYRIKRATTWELQQIETLKDMGLHLNDDNYLELTEDSWNNPIVWLNKHYARLEELGFKVEQENNNLTPYYLGTSEVHLDIQEELDWFDVKAYAEFGAFKIPFEELRHNILNHTPEYKLPDGSIAILPEEWFSQYENMFDFSTETKRIRLKKTHIGLIQDISTHANTELHEKIDRLQGFTGLTQREVSANFNGVLRNYQQAGYNWLLFLKEYGFGGCLADDMGLGKTIQTLSLIQHEMDQKKSGEKNFGPILLIAPTSLIFNWKEEALKFTTDLSIVLHTGSNRSKNEQDFQSADLILTSYGIARIDEELLSNMYFHYIILDESQNIKNPSSKSFSAIRKLKGSHRLVLSGTPVENSIQDLWSQMEFLNPGLLGPLSYFQKKFVVPIEKKKDAQKAEKLQALIKPFVLRRTKEQVATELPKKTEQIIHCPMSDEQLTLYEKIKSEYRNHLLGFSNTKQFKSNKLSILAGLTKLRQIANHPKLLEERTQAESGKLDAVLSVLEPIVAERSKVLIFSQFVSNLQIVKEELIKRRIKFSYLDGSTKDRKQVVDEYTSNQDIYVFLISIKAGGVGLNLTQAQYVFLLDPWWNPAVEQQAIDRTHRIGQKKSVFIYKFITKDTVEEKILQLQQRKTTIADTLIQTEENFFKSLNQEDLKSLIS
ncbi:MAG TPA: DEAD/DEAH box helicase [Candidatus Sphingobacterium stercoripullorum]|nr:DEAD/DEAH box helicase [Candidatus Sphingobacterium stercoripullorum]